MELKPCQFCGSDNVTAADDCGLWWVECYPCGAGSPRRLTAAEVTASWNRVGAVIEAAKAFVEANNSVDGDEWSTYHALETAVEALQEVEQ